MAKPLPKELERIRQECSQDLTNCLIQLDLEIRVQMQYQAQAAFKAVIPFNSDAVCGSIQMEIERVQQKMQRKVERFVQKNGPKVHIVRRGDTLWKIKNRYCLSLDQLRRHNRHISDLNLIQPGQKIMIPPKADLGSEPLVMALEVQEGLMKHIHYENVSPDLAEVLKQRMKRYRPSKRAFGFHENSAARNNGGDGSWSGTLIGIGGLIGNVGGSGLFGVDMVFGAVKNNFNTLQRQSDTYRLGLNYGKAAGKVSNVLKWSSRVGGGLSWMGVGLSVTQFGFSDQSAGDFTRLGVNAIILGLTVTPEPASTAVGIGLGLMEGAGTFNAFYIYADELQWQFNRRHF